MKISASLFYSLDVAPSQVIDRFNGQPPIKKQNWLSFFFLFSISAHSLFSTTSLYDSKVQSPYNLPNFVYLSCYYKSENKKITIFTIKIKISTPYLETKLWNILFYFLITNIVFFFDKITNIVFKSRITKSKKNLRWIFFIIF